MRESGARPLVSDALMPIREPRSSPSAARLRLEHGEPRADALLAPVGLHAQHQRHPRSIPASSTALKLQPRVARPGRPRGVLLAEQVPAHRPALAAERVQALGAQLPVEQQREQQLERLRLARPVGPAQQQPPALEAERLVLVLEQADEAGAREAEAVRVGFGHGVQHGDAHRRLPVSRIVGWAKRAVAGITRRWAPSSRSEVVRGQQRERAAIQLGPVDRVALAQRGQLPLDLRARERVAALLGHERAQPLAQDDGELALERARREAHVAEPTRRVHECRALRAPLRRQPGEGLQLGLQPVPLRAVRVALLRRQVLDVEHRILDQRAAQEMAPPGPPAVLGGGVVLLVAQQLLGPVRSSASAAEPARRSPSRPRSMSNSASSRVSSRADERGASSRHAGAARRGGRAARAPPRTLCAPRVGRSRSRSRAPSPTRRGLVGQRADQRLRAAGMRLAAPPAAARAARSGGG